VWSERTTLTDHTSRVSTDVRLWCVAACCVTGETATVNTDEAAADRAIRLITSRKTAKLGEFSNGVISPQRYSASGAAKLFAASNPIVLSTEFTTQPLFRLSGLEPNTCHTVVAVHALGGLYS
jgi:hypothetical protein